MMQLRTNHAKQNTDLHFLWNTFDNVSLQYLNEKTEKTIQELIATAHHYYGDEGEEFD